ncbi:hypothetical protein EDC14_101345 [Hydrogenispora ethanolica]|uniref:CYTH domain-containing protein n=1 Tax=Hydrogenispora ethanolica TaxID=1082276 RepID=A0A4R1RQ48_HYDET|nr:hypothetical protein [Hydrogenispora ethanolica]TCL68505.1 hypothetical protein EDC14_101345 [Hydrogenispora ethanolica]
MSLPSYEVETRFYFSGPAEAFAVLPFGDSALTRTYRWRTVHYSPALFQRDEILRIGYLESESGPKVLLGWKGPDRGKLINIREELDEDVSGEIAESRILAKIGGRSAGGSAAAVAAELERLGHRPFMEFSGENRVGYDEPLGLHLKLSHCQTLRHSWLFEIEKTAATLAEVPRREAELLAFIEQYRLAERVVRAEPPTLLYEASQGRHGGKEK